jgi:hypothetical protein
MPYSIAWYVPNHVVYVRYWDGLTAQEFREYLNAVEHDYLDHGHSALVHIVVDTAQATSLPTLEQLTSSIRRNIHPKSGWMLVSGVTNPATRWMGEFASKLFKFRYRSFNTLPEAMAFLKEKEPTVDWSQADESVLG